MLSLLAGPLFTANAASGRPTLLGGICPDCAFVSFPLQPLGCERCGAPRLEPQGLDSEGLVVALAEVHVHPDRSRTTPFTVVVVLLDCGVHIRALASDARGTVTTGTRVEGYVLPGSGDDAAEWRFVRATEA